MLLIGIFILVILDIIAIFDCLETNKDTTLRLIWILVIIIFPVMGMLVYFFSASRRTGRFRCSHMPIASGFFSTL